jgi:hypothetical protein
MVVMQTIMTVPAWTPIARCLERTSVCTLLALALSSLCPDARADDGARAASLAHEGQKLMNAGKHEEACAKLDESQRLDPLSSTAIELGRCREKENRPGAAYRAYGAAEDLAKKEGRTDRMIQARQARGKLTFKIARVTIEVPKPAPGMVVTIDGEPMPESAWGKSYETDPGSRTLVAEAPGYERWEDKAQFAAGRNRSIAVPALAAAKPGAPAPPPKPGAAPPPKDELEPEPPEEDDDDDGAPPGEHESNRIVVEIGALGGLLYSDISRGELSELFGVSYEFNTNSGGILLASCGDLTTIPGGGECEALFDPLAGGIVGGELFIAWAVHEAVHLGGRAFGGARLPEGFFVYGGPSVSFRVAGPLWLGATFVVGTEQHRSQLASARGSVPPEYQAANGASDQVEIPLENVPFSEGDVLAGVMFGGSLEVSVSLVGPSPHALAPTTPAGDWATGAFMVGLWPAFLKAPDGFVLSVPAGFSYRFH